MSQRHRTSSSTSRFGNGGNYANNTSNNYGSANRLPQSRPCWKCGVPGHHANYCPKEEILKQARQRSKKKRSKKKKSVTFDVDSSSSSSASSASSSEVSSSESESSSKRTKKAKRKKSLSPRSLANFEKKNPGKLFELLRREKIEKREKKARAQVSLMAKLFKEETGLPFGNPTVSASSIAVVEPTPAQTATQGPGASPTLEEIQQTVLETMREVLPLATKKRRLQENEEGDPKELEADPLLKKQKSEQDARIETLERQIQKLSPPPVSPDHFSANQPPPFGTPGLVSPFFKRPMTPTLPYSPFSTPFHMPLPPFGVPVPSPPTPSISSPYGGTMWPAPQYGIPTRAEHNDAQSGSMPYLPRTDRPRPIISPQPLEPRHRTRGDEKRSESARENVMETPTSATSQDVELETLKLRTQWIDLQKQREANEFVLQQSKMQMNLRKAANRTLIPARSSLSESKSESKTERSVLETKGGEDEPLPQRTQRHSRANTQSRISFQPATTQQTPLVITDSINQQPTNAIAMADDSVEGQRAVFIESLKLPPRLRVRGKVWDHVRFKEECDKLGVEFQSNQLKELARKLAAHIQ